MPRTDDKCNRKSWNLDENLDVLLFSVGDVTSSHDGKNIEAQNFMPLDRGACTNALLKVLNEENEHSEYLSFENVLTRMGNSLDEQNVFLAPQISSTRPLNINEKFRLIPEECKGTLRALIIGINYMGQDGELRGRHNDAINMKEYIKNVIGFSEENILLLLDDGMHLEPTKDNILNAFQNLSLQCKNGDSCFVYLSGHGGELPKNCSEDEDECIEVFVPSDCKGAGLIYDEEIINNLLDAIPVNVFLTCVIDCSRSGMFLNLPWAYYVIDEDKVLTRRDDLPSKSLFDLDEGDEEYHSEKCCFNLKKFLQSTKPSDHIDSLVICCALGTLFLAL